MHGNDVVNISVINLPIIRSSVHSGSDHYGTIYSISSLVGQSSCREVSSGGVRGLNRYTMIRSALVLLTVAAVTLRINSQSVSQNEIIFENNQFKNILLAISDTIPYDPFLIDKVKVCKYENGKSIRYTV